MKDKKLAPGRVFAEAAAIHGTDTMVEFDYTISDALLGTRQKVRLPVRNIFKIFNLAERPLKTYWFETPAKREELGNVFEGELRPEAANSFHAAPVPPLLPTRTWVQVPPILMEDAVAFEEFVDFRLVIRLATAENQALTRGEAGLLKDPAIPRMTSKADLGALLLEACNGVEQVGVTGDGLILNPADYWRLVGQGHLMADLEAGGVRIVRTRMVPRGQAIFGDFAHGAYLLDSGRSVIRFAEPPPGTFAQPGLALMAEIHERLVVNLPANFFHLTSLAS